MLASTSSASLPSERDETTPLLASGAGAHAAGGGLEYLLESGPSDLRCLGLDGPVAVTLAEDVLQVVETSSGHIAREVWLQDITAVYLRPKADQAWSASSPGPTAHDELLISDDDDAEIVIVSFPLSSRPGSCSRAAWCCLCCGRCSCCCSSSSDAHESTASSTSPTSASASGLCCGHLPQRDERDELVLSADSPNLVHHWEYAIVAAVSGKNIPDACVSKAKRMLVIVSPQSGPGNAEKIFEQQVKPILEASRITCEVVVTKGPMDAMHIVLHRQYALHELDGIIAVGGDGIIYEIVQALKKIAGPEERLPVPVGIIPAGSGNGIAASLHHAVNEPVNDPVAAAIGIARGRVQALDLWQVSMLGRDGQPREPCYASLSVSWAFVSDTDIESESMRALGDARFTVQAIFNLVRLRKYKCTLSYLPYEDDGPLEEAAVDNYDSDVDETVADLAVDDPTPDNWVTASGTFLFFWALNASHPTSNSNVVPGAELDSGCIEIVLVRDINRVDFARGLLALDTGEQFDVPGWERIRVRAFRIEPLTPDESIPGSLVVDGELLHEPLQRIQVETTRAHSDFFSYIK